MIKNLSIHWVPSVQVEYEYKKGQSFRVTPTSLQPPEPPVITKLKVVVNESNKTVDITDVLPLEITSEIIDAVIVDIVNQDPPQDEYEDIFEDVKNE